MNKSKFCGHHLIELNSIDSTNNYATNLVRGGNIADGTVIMADYQTEGKGRRGNTWHADANKNLTFTLIRKLKNFLVEDQFLITQVISLAIIETLKDIGLVHSKIKWPNDVLYRRKKISGILIENSLSGDLIETTIIGIGLNVNQEDFNGLEATSIKNECHLEYLKKSLLQSLLENIQAGFYQIQMKNFKWIQEHYNKNLFGIDNFENYRIKGKAVQAKIKNVDRKGFITLTLMDNNEIQLSSLDEIEWIR